MEERLRFEQELEDLGLQSGLVAKQLLHDPALTEWNTYPRIHHHFNNGFQSYRDLRPLYQAMGIQNPASYLNNNIVDLRFFRFRTPGHIDLRPLLRNAESTLRRRGIMPMINSFWSFVPRRIGRTNRLSKHALGRAIDINPNDNPHVINADDIRVIHSVTGVHLGRRQTAAAMRHASRVFQSTFNQKWIDAQGPHLRRSIQKRRRKLDGYARNGFFNLQQDVIDALTGSGFSWGGHWKSSKDFMHFEV